MGTAAADVAVRFRAVGVEQVRSGLKLVKTEAEGAAHSAEGFSHSAAIGIGELARGLGSVAQNGEATAYGMRELSNAAMRLGGALGPAGGLIGVVALLGMSFYEMFSSARDEMKKTRETFEAEIGKMANAGRSADLQQRIKTLEFGQPFDEKNQLRPASAFAKGAFQGSLLDLQGQRSMVISELGNATNATQASMLLRQKAALDAQIATMQAEEDTLRQAIANIADQAADMHGLLPTKVTAQGPGGTGNARRTTAENLIDMLAKLKPGLSVTGSDTLSASQAGADAQQLNALIRKYNPDADHSDRAKQNAAMLASIHAQVRPIVETAAQVLADAQAKIIDQINTNFATGIHSALVNGFQEAFSGNGLKGFAKGFLRTILDVLGDIAITLGGAMIPIGARLSAFTTALHGLNGPAAIAAGIGLLAAGAALKAGAASIGRTNGATGGGYTSATATGGDIIDRGLINPLNRLSPVVGSAGAITPATPVSVTIIGPNDPTAQRQMQELIRNANRRGSLA